MNSQYVDFAESTRLVSRERTANEKKRQNILIGTGVILFIVLVGILLASVFIAVMRDGDEYERKYINYVKLEDGFKIDYFCRLEEEMPRQLAVAHDRRIVFAGTKTNKVVAMLDQDNNRRCDRVITVVDGLELPMGVALHNGDLFILDTHRILRVKDIFRALEENEFEIETVYDKLPVPEPYELGHPPAYLNFDKEGYLFVQIGVPWNENQKDWTKKVNQNPLHGAMLRFVPPDYKTFEVVATGLRNSGGFEFDPITDLLWIADNGRNQLNDETPPDELNLLSSYGKNFGYPMCHGCCVVDPELNIGGKCPGNTSTPALALKSHAAALGLAFNKNSRNFPAHYLGDLFIAEHGSAVSEMSFPPNGYRIARVRMEPNFREPLSYETFADFSWAQGKETWVNGIVVPFGRIVDIKFLHDGSMIASDDEGRAIYRISYR